MVWGYSLGAALTAYQLDERDSEVLAWVLAGVSMAGVSFYIGRELWQRHQGPGNDMDPRFEMDLPTFGGVNNLMPPGPGWRVRSKKRAYGTAGTVAGLVRAFTCYRELRPTAPQLVVWDISRQGGGVFPPHKSHQTGRDVDIGTPGWPRPDFGAIWDLIRCFDRDPGVRVIFFDKGLQNGVADAADAAGDTAEARRLLSVRGGRFVRPWPGHRNHLHVRFGT